MGDVISWVLGNWELLVSALFALLTAASIVTRFTSTPDDDAFVRKLIGWLSFLRPGDQGGSVKVPLTSARDRSVVEARPGADDSDRPRLF